MRLEAGQLPAKIVLDLLEYPLRGTVRIHDVSIRVGQHHVGRDLVEGHLYALILGRPADGTRGDPRVAFEAVGATRVFGQQIGFDDGHHAVAVLLADLDDGFAGQLEVLLALLDIGKTGKHQDHCQEDPR
jgi:hypothetical protein